MSVHSEARAVRSASAPNCRTGRYVQQTCYGLKGEIEKATVLFGDVNTLSVIDSNQTENQQAYRKLPHTINQKGLIIYKPMPAEYTLKVFMESHPES